MVRDHREGLATLFVDDPLAEGALVSLERCADHIRARRLRAGDPLGVTNGQGIVAHGALRKSDRGGWTFAVAKRESVTRKMVPRLFAPVADRTRLLWLAEKAVEIGIESWCLVEYTRSASVAPRGEGTGFREKVRARMVAALEQSGGAWLPAVEPDISLQSLANRPGQGRFILHPDGRPLISALRASAGACSIAVGPEGGLERAELDLLTDAGWAPVSLGQGILRFETAGVAALAIARAVQHVTEE